MKWFRFSEYQPTEECYFIYSTSVHFKIGVAVMGDRLYLMLQDEDTEKDIFYWSEVELSEYTKLVEEDIINNPLEAQPETSETQTPLTEWEKFELEKGVLWSYRHFKSPLNSFIHGRNQPHDESI